MFLSLSGVLCRQSLGEGVESGPESAILFVQNSYENIGDQREILKLF